MRSAILRARSRCSGSGRRDGAALAAQQTLRQDEAASVKRKTDRRRLANEFQTAVGQIVDSVSAAAVELAAAAGSLNVNAYTTRDLSFSATSAVRASFRQRSVGGLRLRGTRRVGRRDQSPGP